MSKRCIVHETYDVSDGSCPHCEISSLEDEIVRLENENKAWIGIKEDREERIEERDEARALAQKYLRTLLIAMPNAKQYAAEQRNTYPWLQECNDD